MTEEAVSTRIRLPSGVQVAPNAFTVHGISEETRPEATPSSVVHNSELHIQCIVPKLTVTAMTLANIQLVNYVVADSTTWYGCDPRCGRR